MYERTRARTHHTNPQYSDINRSKLLVDILYKIMNAKRNFVDRIIRRANGDMNMIEQKIFEEIEKGHEIEQEKMNTIHICHIVPLGTMRLQIEMFINKRMHDF